MILLLFGVSGSGKSTVGRALAERLGSAFVEGDAFHSPENVAKMARGEGLDDADRAPWLVALRAHLAQLERLGVDAVVACSALRERYRRFLAEGVRELRFVFLRADPALVRDRLGARRGHFAKEGLIESQFAALEEPVDGLALDAARPVDALVEAIVEAFGPR